MGQAAAFALPRLKAAVRDSATSQAQPQPTIPTIWPDQLTGDTPLQQVLFTVQSFGLPLELPIAAPTPVLEPCEPKATPSIPLSFRSWVGLTDWLKAALVNRKTEPFLPSSSEITILQPKQTNALVLIGQNLLSVASRSVRVVSLLIQQSSQYGVTSESYWQLDETATDWIRGVASWLDTRSLVLVTNRNQVLDVLTPEQQTRLRQRIIWEVAHVARYRKLRAETRLAVTCLNPEKTRPYLLPPVRWFYRLMAWIQTSPLAIATNLFQEADLPAPTNGLPLLRATNSISPASPTAFILPQAKTLAPEILLPTGEQTLLRDLVQTGGAIQIVNQPAFRPTQLIQAMQAAVAKLRPQPSISRQAATALEAASAGLQTRTESTASAHSHVPNYIEAQVTWVGYERSFLSRMLHWLDQGIAWLEAQLLKLWGQTQRWVAAQRSKP
jgi:hypothetical protein